jgi:hypothetical protein
MKRLVLCLLLATCPAADESSANLLYDPGLNSLPDAQGWAHLSLPVASVRSVDGTTTRLDTTSLTTISAGYSIISPESLDRSQGFELTIDLQLTSETHVSNDRAGFSIILLADDLQGIELGFWGDEIWAQDDSPLFTHAEGVPVDTTAALTTYRLRMVGGSYELFASDLSILSGPLRDYTAFTGFPDVYETPNFLFWGDDTTSAQADVRVGTIELALIPEPGAAALLLSGAVMVARLRRRRQR